MPSTDTVTAKLTPGEFVIKKSAVDILGLPLLRKLNNMPEEGGHGNIDELISMATLEGAKPMTGGGITTPNGVMGYQNGGFLQDYYKRLEDFDEEKIREKSLQYGTPLDSIPKSWMFSPEQFTDVDVSKAAIDKKGIEKAYGGRFRQALSIPASEVGGGKGSRYYIGDAQYRGSLPDASLQYMAIIDALEKMQSTPQDSIPKALLGYQEGDVVQDDAMMQQFLQQQQMQQQQPQQQGQQQPSIAPPGAAAGQTMSWGEPGDYMNSLTATRDSLYQAAEQAKIDSANQSLEAIKLDSLIQSLGKEGERIERTPEDSNFYKNTPDQDAWLQKHKNNIAVPFFNR